EAPLRVVFIRSGGCRSEVGEAEASDCNGGLSPPGLVVWLCEELLFAVEWSD
ncbi:hypothetical protein HID58_025479, partial [Brassica napus]